MSLNIKDDFDQENDIIDFQEPQAFLGLNKTVFANQLNYEINDILKELGIEKLLDGVECRVIQSGKPWTSGKLVMKIEFVPDEVETKTDDAYLLTSTSSYYPRNL